MILCSHNRPGERTKLHGVAAENKINENRREITDEKETEIDGYFV